MNINHDRSYIDASSLDFVQRGYAIEDLHSLRIRFEYTEEEKQANKAFADSHTNEEWNTRCADMAQIRSNAMRPVMEALGRKFVCYQFEPDCGVDYSSDKWDLFFWCNDFYQTTGGKFSGRDYSYITLTFNDRMTADQRLDVCNRVLKFLVDRFEDHIHLSVVVQYKVTMDDKKIAEDAKAALPSLVGQKCTYGHMDGKIVETERGVFFVKKYARTRGYQLSDSDVLRLSWKLGVA